MPIAAAILVAITGTGSFRRREQAMFIFLAVSLLAVPLLLLSHPSYGQVSYHLVVPGVAGGVTSDAVLLIIAIVDTTVAPWQLFFQQSSVIDKRITPRFIGHERTDTVIGSVATEVGAIAMVLAAYAVRGTARMLMERHHWRWKEFRRRHTTPEGHWLPITGGRTELRRIDAIPVTRYRYRGSKIPSPWPLPEHA